MSSVQPLCSFDALAKYETGVRGIAVEDLVRLAAVLKTTVGALVGDTQ